MLMRKIVSGMIVIIFAAMAGTAFGTQYYVDPEGSDVADGLSWGTAFATINHGIDTASNGDVIDVNEGTYSEAVDFDGKSVTVQSTEPNDWEVVAATIIDVNNPSLNAVTLDTGEDADSVLRGFTVTRGLAGVYVDSDSPVIARCIVQGNGIGVEYRQRSKDTFITNNKIYGNSSEGIFGHKGDATIKSNLVYENDIGIKVVNGASADTYNNTIVDNSTYGIEKSGGQSAITIVNCLIWNNSDDLQLCSATYSCISDCGDVGNPEVTHNFCSDPLFIDTGNDDYGLEKTSPCIDAGNSGFAEEEDSDIDNHARICGTAVDISSFEEPTVFVKKGASGANDGTTWVDAYGELSEALSSANLRANAVIWVARGTYTPGTAITDAFHPGIEGVHIYGGFRGDEPINFDVDERNFLANETILSGDIDSDGVLDDDNSCHVVKIVPGSEGVILDGLTITGGNANGTVEDSKGGGIYCYDAASTLRNCIVKDNKSSGEGGGMYASQEAVTLINCVFSNNTASSHGGGVSIHSGAPNYRNIEPGITGCVFSGNYSGGRGGGLYSYFLADTILTNCTFRGNEALISGGGICAYKFCDLTLRNCILWDDYASTGNEIYLGPYATVDATYCCVKGGYTGYKNLSWDPLFVKAHNPAGPDGAFRTFDDGLRLRPDSGYVDYGTGGAIDDTGVTTDVIGYPRKIDGDHNSSAMVDRGAYELPLIWYVDKNGDNADGESWETAYQELRDALSTLGSLTKGNEIWVAGGTYDPNDDIGSAREDSFQLISDVPIRGGYGADDPYAQDFLANNTTLSGDIDGDKSPANNSYHVVDGNDRGTLEGFTITGGNADGTGDYQYGGGIYCKSTSPTISNCIISGNKAKGDTPGDDYRGGGGMYLEDSDSFVTNCEFISNTCDYGGGVYNLNCSALLTFTHCIFMDNLARDYGGGLFSEDSSPTITNCVFRQNKAKLNGGGMYNNGEQETCEPKIINCIFSGNHSFGHSIFPSSPYGGGGMDNYDASPEVINCTFSRNVTRDGGGGMRNHYSSSPKIINCIFWDNMDSYYTNLGGIQWFTDESAQILGGSPDVSYTCIQGLDDFAIQGKYNIGDDPIFKDVERPEGMDGKFLTWDDGLGIVSYSPCVDKAEDVNAPSSDIRGIARVDVLYSIDDNGTADMGAYETPTVWYVDENGDDSDGESWETAFQELRDALNPSVNTDLASGDEIWVADGTYMPTGVSTERSASFELVEGVSVYGGFSGYNADSQRRDWTRINQTILSGDIDGDGVLNSGNSLHVVDCNDGAVLDGFTITHGYAIDGSTSGGGIYCDQVSPTIRNCVITGNRASGYGGGMYNYYCEPTLTNCFFVDNIGSGGGMYNSHSDPLLTNCVFSGNEASGTGPGGDGGGIRNNDSSPSLINCTFNKNKAGSSGGGIENDSYSEPVIINSIFWGNSDYYGMGESSQISGGTVEAAYSCIQGLDSLAGNNNIDEDPLFKGPVAYWKMDDNASNPYVAGLYGEPEELVLCGGFAGGCAGGYWDWPVGGCWSWAPDATAHFCGTVCYLPQDIYAVQDMSYSVTYSIVWHLVSWCSPYIGGQQGTSRNDEGTYTELITASDTSGLLEFFGVNGEFKIDNVFVFCEDVFPNTGILSDGTMNPQTSQHIVSGQIDDALDFGGSDDTVQVPDSDEFDLTDFTLSGWVDTSATSNQVIISQENVSDYWAFRVDNDGNLSYALSHEGDTWVNESDSTVNDGDWHHVVLVRDAGSRVSFYVDGELNGTFVSDDGSAYEIDGDVFVGSYGGSSQFFNGAIDEVMVFNRALSTAEIRQLYERGSAGEAYIYGAGPDGICGTQDDDARLDEDSPCVDEGDNSAVDAAGLVTDIFRQARVQDGNEDGNSVVDMGAFELPMKYVYAITWLYTGEVSAYSIVDDKVTYRKAVSILPRSEALALTIEPDSATLFISEHGVTFNNDIGIVNAITMTPEECAMVTKSYGSGILWDKSKEKLYFLDRGQYSSSYNQLHIYSWDAVTKTLSYERSVDLEDVPSSGEAYDIALDEGEHRLFVTNDTSTVYYYNTDTWAYEDNFTVQVGENEREAMGIAFYNDVAAGKKYLYAGRWYGSYYHPYLVRTDITTIGSPTSEEKDISGGVNGVGVLGITVDEDTGLVYITTSGSEDNIQVYDNADFPNESPCDVETTSTPTGIVFGGRF